MFVEILRSFGAADLVLCTMKQQVRGLHLAKLRTQPFQCCEEDMRVESLVSTVMDQGVSDPRINPGLNWKNCLDNVIY